MHRSQLNYRPLPVVLGNIRATASGTMLAINSLRMSSGYTNRISGIASLCYPLFRYVQVLGQLGCAVSLGFVQLLLGEVESIA